MSLATFGQLDVGVLQHLLDAVGHRRLLAGQLGALAGQVAQLALAGRRDEAGGQQPVLEQLGDPGAVGHVGLAPRHLLDVLGVDEQDLDPALQDVIDLQVSRFVFRGLLHPRKEPKSRLSSRKDRGVQRSHLPEPQ